MDEDSLGIVLHSLSSKWQKIYTHGKKTPRCPLSPSSMWITGTYIEPTENLLMKKILLVIQRFPKLEVCALWVQESQDSSPEFIKWAAPHSFLLAFVLCVVSQKPLPCHEGAETTCFQMLVRPSLAKSAEHWPSQSRYILTSNWNYLPFLGHVKHGVSDGSVIQLSWEEAVERTKCNMLTLEALKGTLCCSWWSSWPSLYKRHRTWHSPPLSQSSQSPSILPHLPHFQAEWTELPIMCCYKQETGQK